MTDPAFESRYSPLVLGYIAHRFVEGYSQDTTHLPNLILVIIAVAFLTQEMFHSAITADSSETFDDMVFKIIEEDGGAALLELTETVELLKARITDGILLAIKFRALAIGRDATLRALPTPGPSSTHADRFRKKFDEAAKKLGKLMANEHPAHIIASLGVKF